MTGLLPHTSEINALPLRVAFVGAGWIGVKRAERLLACEQVVPCAIADPDAARAELLATRCHELQPTTGRPRLFADATTLLNEATDLGVHAAIIATPSAMHAEQAVHALERGLSVFVQKPLARTCLETARVVNAARRADRVLGVDFSYRGVHGMTDARRLIAEGSLGQVFAVELAFHNAYGPDKGWFYDRVHSGGGCLMDLGCHLVDLMLWMLPNDPVVTVNARRYVEGALMPAWDQRCEDFATTTITTTAGVTAHLACSWRAHAGRDAVISASFFGTRGGIRLSNVAGSFTDFVVEHHRGTSRTVLGVSDPSWDGVEIRHWARRVQRGEHFCAERATQYLAVADVLDLCYAH